jgi:uncharacterized lipoprotein YajG
MCILFEHSKIKKNIQQMKKLALLLIPALLLLNSCRDQEETQGADVSVPVRVAEIVKKPIFGRCTYYTS